MRVSDVKQEYLLSVLAISLMTILQLGCAAQQTSAQQGRETLEETAQAMGGLDALRAIENITRQGTAQTSSSSTRQAQHRERLGAAGPSLQSNH